MAQFHWLPGLLFLKTKKVGCFPVILQASTRMFAFRRTSQVEASPIFLMENSSAREHTVILHDRESRESVQRPPTPIPRIQDIQTLSDPFHQPSGHFYYSITQNGRSEGIDDLSEQLRGIHLNKRGQTDLDRIVDENLISASWNSGSPKSGERKSSSASL